jgi:methyl-accepting chemotaxis protein
VNVGQTSNVAKEIAKDIMDVNSSVIDMSNTSSEVNLNTEELAKMARIINDLVGRFKV